MEKEVNGGVNEGSNERGSGKWPDEKDEEDSTVLAHDFFIFKSKFSGEEAGEDFLAIQRIDGNQVEDGQHNVKRDEKLEKGNQGWKNSSQKA